MNEITIPHLAIFIMALWRISSLFTKERGPFDVFVKVRTLTGIQHDEQGMPWIIPDNVFAQIVSCVWCFSIWASFGLSILAYFFYDFALLLSTVFAFSAGAVLLEIYANKSH